MSVCPEHVIHAEDSDIHTHHNQQTPLIQFSGNYLKDKTWKLRN